jgi:hypothetical protein
LDNATFLKNVSQLMADYPESTFSEELKETDPVKWAVEVYPISVQYVYGNLLQSGGTYIVNQTYADLGRPQARRLIALAGYRLAKVLKTFVDAKSRSLLNANPAANERDNSLKGAIIWAVNGGLVVIVVVAVVAVRYRKSRRDEVDQLLIE